MVLQRTKDDERQARLSRFRALLEQRIVLLDCAMGTMIQSFGLSEKDYRGERFADHPVELKGNNDRFKDLISNEDYEAALDVARQQVENGAQIIDVNMDEGMLEGEEAMVRFLDLLASEPDISRVPVMIDSSRWSIIEAGLKHVQGKAVVNSVSLKEGEEEFVRQARLLKRYGAAVIVMAFDEKGQADTKERKAEICKRAYGVLTEEVGFPPEDIIFDPNVFAIATGIERIELLPISASASLVSSSVPSGYEITLIPSLR